MKRWRLFRGLIVVAGLLSAATAQNPEQVKQQIQRAFGDGDISSAGRLAAQGMQAWPRDPDFPHYRGQAYFRIHKLEQAAADLAFASQLAPQDTDIAFDLGLVKMAQQQYEVAAAQFEKAVQDPQRARGGLVHLMLGRAYQNSNRSELAIQEFQLALRNEPGIKLGHYHLGYAYQSIGRTKEALTEYEAELKRTPDVAEVLYQCGKLLAQSGAISDGIVQLRKAAALDPQNFDAHYELGKALLLSGDPKDAVPSLQKAAELDTNAPHPHFQLAKAYQKLGDKTAAAREEQKFMELKKLQKATGGMATGQIR